MLTHIVAFQLTDAADAAELVGRLLALRGAVPSLRDLEAGVDVVHSPSSYDVGLVCRFDSLADLDAYRSHPAHVEVLEWINAHTTGRVAVDFES